MLAKVPKFLDFSMNPTFDDKGYDGPHGSRSQARRLHEVGCNVGVIRA